MVVKNKKRREIGPDRERLRRDKDVIVRQRATAAPAPFVSELSVREGVSTLEILKGDEKDTEMDEWNRKK